MRPVLRYFSALAICPNQRLVEESNNLSGHVLPTGLLVVHNASRRGENDVTELTGRKQLDDPLLELGKADVVPWGDNTALVQTAIELNDNLAGPVVIDFGEFPDEACR
jgi:hypothetical protein